jgi:hypothetical protein
MIRTNHVFQTALALGIAVAATLGGVDAAAASADAAAPEAPPQEELVLWLDAQADGAITLDDSGRVMRWEDRSPGKLVARPIDAADAPRPAKQELGGRAAVHFDGRSALSLGAPSCLDFKPGEPFSIVAVHRVEPGKSGTLVAKGGHSAGNRTFQLYVNGSRTGAIVHGTHKLGPAQPAQCLAVLQCDGQRVRVTNNGQLCFTARAGKGRSDCDVLLGARRDGENNAEIAYPLHGDLAELLIYRRMLGKEDLAAVVGYVNGRYGTAISTADPTAPETILRATASPTGDDALQLAAAELGRDPAEAAACLGELLAADDPLAPLAAAELLLRIAGENRLDQPLPELAGELLSDDDPFVRGMAAWAISRKVGHENNGQEQVWPGSKPPAWLRAWLDLSADARLQNDYVRQAVSRGLHRDPARLAADVEKLLERAVALRDALEQDGLPAEALAAIDSHRAELATVAEKLGQLTPADAAAASTAFAQAQRLWLQARRQMRPIAMAHPAADVERLLLLTRFAPHTIRNITRAYQWKYKPGGDIVILEGLQPGAATESVLRGQLGPGHLRGMDLWWDGDRVVFGYARQPEWPPAIDTTDYHEEGAGSYRLRQILEPIHIFEIGIDGSNLRQRTDHAYWSDFEPTYCRDGSIVFSSERCGRSAECGRFDHDHANVNLYVVSPDDRVWRLTDNKDVDRYPHSLDNGLIAFTRWEYQERHFMEVHSIWTARPDGSMVDALYKQHMSAPCGLRDVRSIPGGRKMVAIATGHHTFAWGPLCIVDPRWGLNNVAGLSVVTPGSRPQEGAMVGHTVPEGGVAGSGGLYCQPWALSDDCFLVGYCYARPNCTAHGGADSNGFGIYLVDVWGNKELIYRDPILSCGFPMPLRPRSRPPALPPATDPEQDEAVCYVTDMYDGMPEVPRGTVKYLRISQHIGWPFDAERGAMPYIPNSAWQAKLAFPSWSPVRVIGTVPVAEDGSAHFTVPADTAVYFQALDENRMEIRRMRTMVSLQSGEVRGCRGCHASEAKAPVFADKVPLALRREPDRPEPPPWGAEKMLGYEWLVQPILDRHCVECHGADQPAGEIDLSATRAEDGLLQSYRTIMGYRPGEEKRAEPLVSCSNRFSNAAETRPKQFGSHRSRLIGVLRDDPLHRTEVELSERQWAALVTWVDANAPYFDAFIDKRPAEGEAPKRGVAPDLTLGK